MSGQLKVMQHLIPAMLDNDDFTSYAWLISKLLECF